MAGSNVSHPFRAASSQADCRQSAVATEGIISGQDESARACDRIHRQSAEECQAELARMMLIYELDTVISARPDFIDQLAQVHS